MEKRNKLLMGTAAALAASATLILSPNPAAAKGYYPPGCSTWSGFHPFADNCYLGSSSSYIDTSAGFIYGIQYAIGDNDTTYDFVNDYTNDIETRVKKYQNINGLAPDGIVGPATWSKFQSSLIGGFCFTSGGFDYYNENGCTVMGPTFRIAHSSLKWYTSEQGVGLSPKTGFAHWYRFGASFI